MRWGAGQARVVRAIEVRDAHVAEFAAVTGRATQLNSVGDHSATDAGSAPEIDHVFEVLGGAKDSLSAATDRGIVV